MIDNFRSQWSNEELVRHIRCSAQLAAVLEVSGWPKPGNVHRMRDHPDTCYEHFLAGSIALGSAVEDAAKRGLKASEGRIEISGIGIGELVKKAVLDVTKSQNGGNTHLGICLLFIPLAAAGAKTYNETRKICPITLQDNVGIIMRSSTPADAAEVYDAIKFVGSLNKLGKIDPKGAPDLYDGNAKMKLFKDRISLFDVMVKSSSYDTVARELASCMQISFGVGYKTLMETFNCSGNINVATVHTFLTILSGYPDTFIARKIGVKKEANVIKAVEIGVKETIWISKTSRTILRNGGLTTSKGRQLLSEFDKKLQDLGKEYSPGTTADLTASSLMISLLEGLRY